MRRLVLGIAIAAVAWAPAVGQADDQRIAEFIKNRIQAEQQAGNLRGFNIDMRVEQGTVWFKGHVANETQEMMVLKAGQAAGHLGAVQVVDEIDVQSMAAPVVNAGPVAMPLMPMPQKSVMVNYQEPVGQLPTVQAAPLGMPTHQSSHLQAMQASAPMPLPMAAGGQEMNMAGGQPNMPGYAWPGYAAYPNYGACTYPTQYSPSAWPYIGPFYPYPQVPLGWRRVELEWDDGWWFLDFHDR